MCREFERTNEHNPAVTMSMIFDEYGRPFIILREQQAQARIRGKEAQKVRTFKIPSQKISGRLVVLCVFLFLAFAPLAPSRCTAPKTKQWLRTIAQAQALHFNPLQQQCFTLEKEKSGFENQKLSFALLAKDPKSASEDASGVRSPFARLLCVLSAR